MIKMIHLVNRIPEIDTAQFRKHYEESHVPMVVKFCGHVMSEYRRHYVTGGGSHPEQLAGGNDAELEYDAITEMSFENADDLMAFEAALNVDAVKTALRFDTAKFLDESRTKFFLCETVETPSDQLKGGGDAAQP